MQRIVFESISPFFTVADIEAAIAWYSENLGFSVGWTWGEPPTAGNVTRNKISISFGQGEPGSRGSDVFIVVVNVDHYHAELLARDLDVGAIADRDYGMRDFAVTDPWGNRLVFGEPVQEAG